MFIIFCCLKHICFSIHSWPIIMCLVDLFIWLISIFKDLACMIIILISFGQNFTHDIRRIEDFSTESLMALIIIVKSWYNCFLGIFTFDLRYFIILLKIAVKNISKIHIYSNLLVFKFISLLWWLINIY